VDRLNKELMELNKQDKNENTGPDEGKKNNMKKEIEIMKEKINGIQKEWIKHQTKLVRQ